MSPTVQKIRRPHRRKKSASPRTIAHPTEDFPSLALFLMLPLLLRLGWGFWISLLGATGATVVCYGVMVTVLQRLGVSL